MKTLIIFVLSLVVSLAVNAEQQIQYDIRIDGITCPFCVSSSEKALKELDGINTIRTNIETGTMTVCAEPSVTLADQQLKQLFLKQGFTYRHFALSQGCSLSDNATLSNDPASTDNHEYH